MKVNRKIAKTIFMTMLILSMLAGIYVFATNVIKETTGQAIGGGQFISYEQLQNEYYILCRQHGTHIPSEADTQLSTSHGVIDCSRLTANSIGTKYFQVQSESNPFSQSSYTGETLGYYESEGTAKATPQEAYVLAEASNNTGSYPSYVQDAWWDTQAGGQGQTGSNNELSREAQAFEDYIVAASGASDGSSVPLGENGAFAINYQPKMNEDANQDGTVNKFDNITVSYNEETKQYLVGPYSIDYAYGAFEDKLFAGITGATITTNQGTLSDEDWSFYYLSSDREKSEDYAYPLPNEVFFLAIDFKDGLKCRIARKEVFLFYDGKDSERALPYLYVCSF